jgi:hypothetical protein
VITEPLLDAGAEKVMEAWALPAVAVPITGALGTPALTVRVTCAVVPVLDALSVTVTVNTAAPVALGVPVILPLVVSKLRPRLATVGPET